jgi:hypothetical protein
MPTDSDLEYRRYRIRFMADRAEEDAAALERAVLGYGNNIVGWHMVAQCLGLRRFAAWARSV